MDFLAWLGIRDGPRVNVCIVVKVTINLRLAAQWKGQMKVKCRAVSVVSAVSRFIAGLLRDRRTALKRLMTMCN